MTSLEKIKTEVTKLSKPELVSFRAWFAEFDAKNWDEKFERDVRAGKFARLAQKAQRQFKAGQCTEL